MDFKAKYTNTTDKAKLENKDKIVLADGEFAFCETLSEGLERIRQAVQK